MGRKILVTIVGEQTVPNVLFIKSFDYSDSFIFITTNKMETNNTTQNIIDAANISHFNNEKILVIEDSLIDIDEKLSTEIDLNDEDVVLVNITGGTKLMSLGVYNFFARHGAANIFYIPIGKNEIRQIFPLRKNRVKPLSYKITLREYLVAYGVSFKEDAFLKKNNLLKPKEVAENLFNAFTGDSRQLLFALTESIRPLFRGKPLRPDKDSEAALLPNAWALKEYGMAYEDDSTISKYETRYITGDWFEEYVYRIIKDTLDIKDDFIGIGVQLVKGEAPNEYDIIFVKNNSLYVIECKTDIADYTEEGDAKISYLFTNTLYKAATLKKEFGLWVNYYLCALNDFSLLSETLLKRAKQLDVKLIGLEVLKDQEIFKEFIRKI